MLCPLSYPFLLSMRFVTDYDAYFFDRRAPFGYFDRGMYGRRGGGGGGFRGGYGGGRGKNYLLTKF